MKSTRIDVVPNYGHVQVEEEQSTLHWFDQTYRVPTPIHVEIKNDASLIKLINWIDSAVDVSEEEEETWASESLAILNPFTNMFEKHSPRPLPLKCKTVVSLEPFDTDGLDGDMNWQTTMRNSLVEVTNTTSCVWGFLALGHQQQANVLQDWFFDLENISVALNHHEHGYLVAGEQRVVDRFIDDDPYYTVVTLGKGKHEWVL